MASFEQLDDARQTAGDVLRLRRGARDTGQRITRVDFLTVLHHDVRAGRQKVLALFAASDRMTGAVTLPLDTSDRSGSAQGVEDNRLGSPAFLCGRSPLRIRLRWASSNMQQMPGLCASTHEFGEWLVLQQERALVFRKSSSPC